MRFTIRDLLWLTLVVAISLGWWIDRNRNYQAETVRWYRRAMKAKDAATGEGWTVEWEGDRIEMSKPGRKPIFLP